MGLLTNEGEGGKKALCHSHPTMMKLGTITSYPKKIQKYESKILLTLAFFHQRSAYFAISTNTDIDCILIHGGGGGGLNVHVYKSTQAKINNNKTRTDSDDESEIMKTFQNLLHITAKNQHSPIIHLKN